MLTRIISGAVGLVLLFIVMFSPKAVLLTALMLLSVIALFEVFNAYGYQKNKIFIVLGIISSALFTFAKSFDLTILFAFLFIMFVLCVVIMLLKHNEILSKDIFTIMLLVILIPFVFSAIGYIKEGENGSIYVWIPFIASWVTDTFAYFTGKFLGKHKLCEKISPKKTVEGSIGGILGAVAGFFVYFLAMGSYHGLSFNYLNVVILAVTSSVLSQLGDLFASAIKREHNIKDFGSIMPGHGGVLDRFDSLLLTVPYIFLFLKFLPLIQ